MADTGSTVTQPVGDDPRDRLVAVKPDGIVICRPDCEPKPVDGKLYAPRREYWRGGTLGVVSHERWSEA